MLKPWRFKTTEGSKVHLVGDSHFNHDPNWPEPIWKKRGYNSCHECDEGQIRIWNERVKPEDVVIHVGDFIFKADEELTKRYINRLNGHIYFLWGNHNSGVKQLYHTLLKEFLFCKFSEDIESHEVYPLTYNDKFTFVGNYMYGKVDHIEFVCSHFAHRIWDKMGHGVVHFSGHSHGSDKESNPIHTKGKRLDVGIENFNGPIEFYEAMKIMNKKSVEILDHHSSHTPSSSF